MKRTPKNYDGIESPSKTLKELLVEEFNRITKNSGPAHPNIIGAWPDIIGPKLANMTEAISFIDGVLTVVVKSSSLYSLLCLHERPHLLSKLQKSFPKTQVQNIVFRIG